MKSLSTLLMDQTTEYDKNIQEAANSFLDFLPNWILLKCQYWQESKLDPTAKSSVGAEGIAQIMPDTWNELSHELGIPDSKTPLDATEAIIAGAYYDRKMWNFWNDNRSTDCHIKLMLASYNAGPGNLLKAQTIANGAMDYETISKELHLVTGASAAEQTITYVENIYKFYQESMIE